MDLMQTLSTASPFQSHLLSEKIRVKSEKLKEGICLMFGLKFIIRILL